MDKDTRFPSGAPLSGGSDPVAPAPGGVPPPGAPPPDTPPPDTPPLGGRPPLGGELPAGGEPLSLAGTAEAARALVGLTPIVHAALRRAGVPARDVPDVAQEVLLSVLCCLARRPPAEPAPMADAWSGYLRVAAARRAGHYRAREAQRGLRLGCEADHDASAEPSPEEWVLAAELARALEPGGATSEVCWRALHAYAFAGLTIPQIARAERVPGRVVYARIAQARRDLRALLKRLHRP